MPVSPSFRNQSIDLLCISTDWFLYEGNTGTSYVNWDFSYNLWSGIDAKNRVFVTASLISYCRITFPVVKSNFVNLIQNRGAKSNFIHFSFCFAELGFARRICICIKRISFWWIGNFLYLSGLFFFFLIFTAFSHVCFLFAAKYHFTKRNQCSYSHILIFDEVG